MVIRHKSRDFIIIYNSSRFNQSSNPLVLEQYHAGPIYIVEIPIVNNSEPPPDVRATNLFKLDFKLSKLAFLDDKRLIIQVLDDKRITFRIYLVDDRLDRCIALHEHT